MVGHAAGRVVAPRAEGASRRNLGHAPPAVLPSLDPVRVRAAHRRLGTALGISAAVHVAAAVVWLSLSSPVAPPPDERVFTDYLTAVPPPPALPDVVMLPDHVFEEEDNAGAPSGGGTDVPDDTPPPADGSAASIQEPAEAPAAAERISRTETVQRPTTTPRPSAQAAAAPPPPGAPTSGPPAVGVPGGTGSAPGGASAGSGSGTGGGTGDGTGGPGGGGEGGTGRFVERPEQSPRMELLALPSYPDEARRAGVRARARVRVLIGSDGGVVGTEIVDRTLIDRRGRERSVDTLPYGMEASIAAAAQRSRFRAGRDGGAPVRAYATVVIQIGTDG